MKEQCKRATEIVTPSKKTGAIHNLIITTTMSCQPLNVQVQVLHPSQEPIILYKLNLTSLLLQIVMMVAYFLTPIYTLSEKRQLISDHTKGPLVAVFRSPLMKALDRSVKTLGLWIITSLVTFIKSVNRSSIKPWLTVHLVAMWI